MRYTERYTVTCHDIDINNNIKPSMVLRYMQETANHQMRDCKPSYDDLFLEGKSFILTRITVEIFQQLHQYDEIEVSTWRCPEKAATFIRCYSIERNGECVALAYSEWAVANRITGKLCRAAEVDISHYQTDEVVELDVPLKFRVSKNIGDYHEMGTHHVFYSEVDMNRHMNNTNYPDMLWNYIPDVMDREVTSINLRFMKEAHLDSDIEIFMSEANSSALMDPRAEHEYHFLSKVEAGTNVQAVIGVKKTETDRR